MLIEFIKDVDQWSKGQRMFVTASGSAYIFVDANTEGRVAIAKDCARIVTLDELSVDAASWPAMTPFEQKIFDRFARRYTPPYHQHEIQLEGDGRVADVLAGRRLKKKGILNCWHSCEWYLSDLGIKMAMKRKLELEEKSK